MGFGIIIIIRILFIACMVFIIGYVFGGFSKKPVLKTITKVAAIVLIVLFFASNAFMRAGHGRFAHNGHWQHCDSVRLEERHQP